MTTRRVTLLVSLLLLLNLHARAEWFFSWHAITYDVPMSPASVAIADVNMDGLPDIVAAHSDVVISGFSVLTNKGDGTFAALPFIHFTMVRKVFAEDVNGDGRPDLIAVSYNVNTFFVLTNNGNGFDLASSTDLGAGTAPEGFLAADLNGDGWKEIIVMHGGPLMVYTNDHHGTFTFSTNYYTGGFYPFKGVAGDFNGDGKIDVFVSHYEDGSLIMTNDGAGNLVRGIQPGGAGPFTPHAGDMNHDGRLDVLVNEMLFTNNGGGNFVLANTNIAGKGDTLRSVADLNGDGWLEVLAAGDSGNTLKVRTNDHSNVFATAAKPTLSSDSDIAIADMNGDGWPDVVFADPFANLVGVLFHYESVPLKIERTAPNGIKVSWPFTNPLAYLYSTTNLTPPISWTYRSSFTNIPLMRLEVSTPASETAEFFRLQY